MNLSKAALREFKELYRQVVGDDLSDTELIECVLAILKLVQLVIRHYEQRKGD